MIVITLITRPLKHIVLNFERDGNQTISFKLHHFPSDLLHANKRGGYWLCSVSGSGSAMDSVYTHLMSALYRRHTPYMGQPDYRIHELNKRLQQRSEVGRYIYTCTHWIGNKHSYFLYKV